MSYFGLRVPVFLIHRRDAEFAEFESFLLSAETRPPRLSESDGWQGAESKKRTALRAL